jgi:hypothetical protein
MSMNEFVPMGWRCPNCGSAHAPNVVTCPVQVPTTTTMSNTCELPWKCQNCGKLNSSLLQECHHCHFLI